jgi:hypothetical protein
MELATARRTVRRTALGLRFAAFAAMNDAQPAR